MRLTGKKSFEKILSYITVCVVLHNFLVGNREDDLEEVDDNDDLSKMDADNKLNTCPFADYYYRDTTTRREEVKNYVLARK
jgi:hypothetical protein